MRQLLISIMAHLDTDPQGMANLFKCHLNSMYSYLKGIRNPSSEMLMLLYRLGYDLAYDGSGPLVRADQKADKVKALTLKYMRDNNE
jgi:hypothetical protein